MTRPMVLVSAGNEADCEDMYEHGQVLGKMTKEWYDCGLVLVA